MNVLDAALGNKARRAGGGPTLVTDAVLGV
jgi:hypothetical protein